MTEHRPTPGPGPVPSIVLDQSPPPPRHRSSRPSRWARRTKRFVRTPKGKWTLAAIAAVLALVVGLLSQGYLNDPAPALGDTPSTQSPDALDSLAPTPSASASGSGATSNGSGTASKGQVLDALKAKFAENPLNNLRAGGLHDVSVNVRSSRPVKVVGYLVPTGLSSPYGTPRTNSRSFSLSQQAYGKGYLAAVFVQADQSGVPITCSVSVDGKVTNSETTSGQYGRAVCLG